MPKSSQAARNSCLSAARRSASRRRQAGSTLKKLNLAKVRSAGIALTIALSLLLAAAPGAASGAPGAAAGRRPSAHLAGSDPAVAGLRPAGDDGRRAGRRRLLAGPDERRAGDGDAGTDLPRHRCRATGSSTRSTTTNCRRRRREPPLRGWFDEAVRAGRIGAGRNRTGPAGRTASKRQGRGVSATAPRPARSGSRRAAAYRRIQRAPRARAASSPTSTPRSPRPPKLARDAGPHGPRDRDRHARPGRPTTRSRSASPGRGFDGDLTSDTTRTERLRDLDRRRADDPRTLRPRGPVADVGTADPQRGLGRPGGDRIARRPDGGDLAPARAGDRLQPARLGARGAARWRCSRAARSPGSRCACSASRSSTCRWCCSPARRSNRPQYRRNAAGDDRRAGCSPRSPWRRSATTGRSPSPRRSPSSPTRSTRSPARRSRRSRCSAPTRGSASASTGSATSSRRSLAVLIVGGIGAGLAGFAPRLSPGRCAAAFLVDRPRLRRRSSPPASSAPTSAPRSTSRSGSPVAAVVVTGGRRALDRSWSSSSRLVVLALLALADLVTGANSHFTRSVLDAGGLHSLGDIAQRRLAALRPQLRPPGAAGRPAAGRGRSPSLAWLRRATAGRLGRATSRRCGPP